MRNSVPFHPLQRVLATAEPSQERLDTFLHLPLLMVFSPCLEESLVVFVRLVEDKMGVWYGCGRKRASLEILFFLFPECLQVLSCILQVLFFFLLVYSFVSLFTCKQLKIFFPFKKSTCSLFYPISCVEKAMAPNSSTVAWKNSMDGGAW